MSELLQRLGPNQRRGSKPRCHWITHGTAEEVASRLTTLISPCGRVSASDSWLPRGFDDTNEAQLHKAETLLQPDQCLDLQKWWFKRFIGGKQSSPSFDMASTCTVTIGDFERRGLLLVEAKAHDEELHGEARGKPLTSNPSAGEQANHDHIGLALDGCNTILNGLTGLDWKLSHETRYQMANRFGWAAKLSELGYPVILVYLGFLRAEEMRDQGAPIADDAAWGRLVKSHGSPWIPEEAWDKGWPEGRQSLIPLIRSVEVPYDQPASRFEVEGSEVTFPTSSGDIGSA